MERKAIIIAVSNNKGGVGKTTTTAGISAGLAKDGKKCLMIDADPQANLGIHFGHTPNSESNLYRAITTKRERIPLPIIKSDSTADIVCSHIDLLDVETEFSSEPGSAFILKEVLKNYETEYDFIIIDCPPSLGMMTMNAITAADLVIIPIELGIFAVDGMTRLFQLIRKIKERLNPTIEEPIILMTKLDSRKTIQKKFVERLKEYNTFSTIIRMSSAVEYAQLHGQDIFQEDEISNAANDYLAVSKELIRRYSNGE